MVGAAMMRGQANGGRSNDARAGEWRPCHRALLLATQVLELVGWVVEARLFWLAKTKTKLRGGSQATTALLKQNFGMDLASCVSMMIKESRVKTQNLESKQKAGWATAESQTARRALPPMPCLAHAPHAAAHPPCNVAALPTRTTYGRLQ